MKLAKRHGHRYPWDDWLDPTRGRFTLLRGRDFDAEPYAMAQVIYRAARRRGKDVEVLVRGVQLEVDTNPDPNRLRKRNARP